MLDIALYFLAVIVVAGATVTAYAATRPDTFSISRSIKIMASPDKIFPLINSPRMFNQWTPFLAKDPTTKLVYRGPVSGVGAAHDWAGNRNVGRGSFEIISSTPSSSVVMQLDMSSPIAVRNRVVFTLTPAADATTVVWAMSGSQPLLVKIMAVFFDSDKMVGGDFAQGLANLKVLAET